MAKCSRRVFLSLAAQWRAPTVAPAPAITIVSITHLVHLIAVMASGMYSMGNRFQITEVVNFLHNDSNIFGCACKGGCRRKSIQSEQQSLESYMSYLCVELFFVLQRRSLFLSERPVNQGGLTALHRDRLRSEVLIVDL